MQPVNLTSSMLADLFDGSATADADFDELCQLIAAELNIAPDTDEGCYFSDE